jgi:actin-related protein 7
MDNPVVLDYGSESIKAGYAINVPSEEEPRLVLPSWVEISSPSGPQARKIVQAGRIVDFDGLESILYHILYNRLGWVIGDEGSLLIAEPLFTPKQDREQLTQLLFEYFNCAGVFLHDTAALSLYAVGKQSGCSADIGHGKIDVATVFEGVTNTLGAYRLDICGEDLTTYLHQLLSNRGVNLTPNQLSSLKVQCCKSAESAAAYQQVATSTAAVATNGPSSSAGGGEKPELSSSSSSSYTLPDGTTITTTTAEALSLAESLFQPSLLGKSCMGLTTAISEAILHHPDTGNKRPIYDNTYICGGGSAIPGLTDRIAAELHVTAARDYAPTLVTPPEYMPGNTSRFGPWVGGAVLAKVVGGTSQFMTKGDYEEVGPAGVHRKCS